MIAFLTKNIDLKKSYDIVFIFNNDKLFSNFSLKFNCVNLRADGSIKNMNFKKSIHLDDYQVLNIQKSVYFFLKKRRAVKEIGKRDFNMKVIYELENNNQFKEAIYYLNNRILEFLDEIIYMNIDKRFLKKYKKFIDILFNYVNSFYHAYSMKFFYDERIEIFKMALFLNILNFYRFDRFDLNENGFKRGYLKVISRLFIEQIHKKELIW